MSLCVNKLQICFSCSYCQSHSSFFLLHLDLLTLTYFLEYVEALNKKEWQFITIYLSLCVCGQTISQHHLQSRSCGRVPLLLILILRDHPKHCMWVAKENRLKWRGGGQQPISYYSIYRLSHTHVEMNKICLNFFFAAISFPKIIFCVKHY